MEVRPLKRPHGGAPGNPVSLIYRLYRYILPGVREELDGWRRIAERMPNAELRRQALASMTTKRFHCQGGAVYAAANLPERHVLIPLIVAFQSISDYLDNLCDRSTSMDERDFRELHRSMLDAVDPEAEPGDYYRYRSDRNDGGYLHGLVRACQSRVLQLPSFEVVRPHVVELVSWYGDLQVYKHLGLGERERRLLEWWSPRREFAPGYAWNEFAAAAGSTLGVFMLFLAASRPGLTREEAQAIRRAYFPAICALHIMLDYFIDQEEDALGGDLNFCSYYEDDETRWNRLRALAADARVAARTLPDSRFHLMIVEGLLALYLSDPKVRSQEGVSAVARRLMRASPLSRLFFRLNSVWIRSRAY